MKRVAEIVLVLSAMGRMRGGKEEPTVAEKAMMAEAREKVVAMCEELAPKDIMPREAFGGVIEDLGLNRLKEHQRLGFRAPKLSIVDRMELAKRRIGESKAFAAQTASFPSQQLQTTAAAAVENRVMPPNANTFPIDKPGLVPVLTTGSRPLMPVVHATSATSSISFQQPTSEVRPQSMISSGLAGSNSKKDPLSGGPAKVEVVHYRSDGRPNGTSLVSNVPVVSSAGQQAVKPVSSSFQPFSGNTGTKTRATNRPQIKPEGTASLTAAPITPQVTSVQTTKAVITQTTPGVLPVMHHPVQGVHFVHPAPNFNLHLEISKVVQNLLYPKLPEPPSWTPASRDYMSKVLTCQMCKLLFNEVDSALVCDACEKGFHLRCLQSLNQKATPRGEWHCNRCLSISNGKPFPPKYGRVTRNVNISKGPSNPAGPQLSLDNKINSVDQKANQSHIVANGSSDDKPFSDVGSFAESSSQSKISHGEDISFSGNKAEWPNSDNCSNSTIITMDTTSRPMFTLPISSTSSQLEPKSESCPPERSDTQSGMPAKTPATTSASDLLQGSCDRDDIVERGGSLAAGTQSEFPTEAPTTTSAFDDLQGPNGHNNIDNTGISDGVEAQLLQQDDGGGMNVQMEKSDGCDTISSNPTRNIKQENQDAFQEDHAGSGRVRIEGELSRVPEDNLHDVDWIGDIHRVVGSKKFYQSCSVNGVVYNIQDYALLEMGHGKLIPSKLQAMWEDSQTSSQWVIVNRCYFPSDLPDSVGHPCGPEGNEVYDSNHDMTLMAGFIRGPCEVVPSMKFGEEYNQHEGSDGRIPVFVCKWFYDKIKGVFRPIPG